MSEKIDTAAVLADCERADSLIADANGSSNVTAHFRALVAEVEWLKREYAELKDATWNVPGQPPEPNDSITHEQTRRQAVDQSQAFEVEDQLRDQCAALRERVKALEACIWSAIGRLSSHPSAVVIDGILEGMERIVRAAALLAGEGKPT